MSDYKFQLSKAAAERCAETWRQFTFDIGKFPQNTSFVLMKPRWMYWQPIEQTNGHSLAFGHGNGVGLLEGFGVSFLKLFLSMYILNCDLTFPGIQCFHHWLLTALFTAISRWVHTMVTSFSNGWKGCLRLWILILHQTVYLSWTIAGFIMLRVLKNYVLNGEFFYMYFLLFKMLRLWSGIKLIYLSPYSLDLNPIKECFSWIKHIIQQWRHEFWDLIETGNPDDPYLFLYDLLDQVPADTSQGWFNHSGYI